MFVPLVSMKTLWYKYKKVFEFTELTYKSMQPLKWVEYIEIDATVPGICLDFIQGQAISSTQGLNKISSKARPCLKSRHTR